MTARPRLHWYRLLAILDPYKSGARSLAAPAQEIARVRTRSRAEAIELFSRHEMCQAISISAATLCSGQDWEPGKLYLIPKAGGGPR